MEERVVTNDRLTVEVECMAFELKVSMDGSAYTAAFSRAAW
jgi:hypothetical protein